MSDIWGMLVKRKTLMVPGKKTSNETSQTAAPSAPPAPAPVPTVAPAPVSKPQKVRKTKSRRAKKAQQATQINLADFRLVTSSDAVGIHITTLYQNQTIHRFSLLRPDYQMWQKMLPDQKYMFVRTRTNNTAFDNNTNLIHLVAITTCQILDNLFAESQRAQQAQARRL